ncbi:MAG: hypothetical protein NUW06_02140 [Candidatus Acetothermia bacterium]|nr:hypothetical protein [Candidatus Acetothermia bacterium]MDH7504630.1 hypothetical protein [Candidatus Acetothermia bacterium]
MARHRLAVLLSVVLIGLPLASLGAQEAAPEAEEGIGGGGAMPGVVLLDLAGLNERLAANGYAPLPEMVIVMGGGGYGGEVRGLRFGGLGWGGDATSLQGQKVATFSIGFGGFMVERGLFAGRGYSLSLGAVIGGGGADLDLLDHRSTSFDDALSNPANTALTRGFFGVQAYAGLEFALLDWIMLKVNLGYLWTLGEPWKQAGLPLVGPPESLSAPLVQVMVTFGGRGTLEEGPEE